MFNLRSWKIFIQCKMGFSLIKFLMLCIASKVQLFAKGLFQNLTFYEKVLYTKNKSKIDTKVIYRLENTEVIFFVTELASSLFDKQSKRCALKRAHCPSNTNAKHRRRVVLILSQLQNHDFHFMISYQINAFSILPTCLACQQF